MAKEVIIIGAGVGGLATAVRLLNKGYKVTIYEKEPRVGGKVNILERDGFRFDLTASIVLTPEVYKEIFEEVDRDYREYLEFIRIDPIYRVNYYDGSTMDFSSDLVDLTETIEKISTEDSQGYMDFLSDVYKKYLIANEYFLNKSYRTPRDFLNLTSLVKGLKLKTFTNIYDYISKYVKSEKLRQFLAFQSLYIGISPFEGPNIYSLIPAMSQIHGLWHLKGGMYSYIEALRKMVLELGGSIRLNSNIEKILISNNRAIGVKTKEGEEKADIIVCNADFPYALEDLIKENKVKGKYTYEKLRQMKYSCSTFIIYLALKKKIPKLLVHNHYIGENFKDNIQAAFTGVIPKKPSLYIYCPSRIDNSMAKSMGESLNIVVRVPNLILNNIEWNSETIDMTKGRVFDAMKKIEGLKDFEDNIIYESYLTPTDLETRFNSYGGTAFGLSPTLSQTNYFRPHFKLPSIDNLYFVGSSVHPGSGISTVLISSKLVTEEVLKDDKKESRKL